MTRDETKKIAKDLDSLLGISLEELQEWDVEDLVFYSMDLGGIDSTHRIFNKGNPKRNCPNYQEINTKIEILRQRYLTEARRRDEGY